MCSRCPCALRLAYLHGGSVSHGLVVAGGVEAAVVHTLIASVLLAMMGVFFFVFGLLLRFLPAELVKSFIFMWFHYDTFCCFLVTLPPF